MKNYVLLFHVGATIPDTSEQNAAWGAWFDSLGDAIVDGGNPFNPKEEAQIKKGVVTLDPDTTAGYTIIKATDLKAAVALAMTCPMATQDNCWVKVHQTMPM